GTRRDRGHHRRGRPARAGDRRDRGGPAPRGGRAHGPDPPGRRPVRPPAARHGAAGPPRHRRRGRPSRPRARQPPAGLGRRRPATRASVPRAASGASAGALGRSIWTSCATDSGAWTSPTLSFPIPSWNTETSGCESWRSCKPMSADARPLTVPDLLAMKAAGRRIVMLTCYDAAFARLLEQADVDVLLVGDSLNQVLAGHETTLSATL